MHEKPSLGGSLGRTVGDISSLAISIACNVTNLSKASGFIFELIMSGSNSNDSVVGRSLGATLNNDLIKTLRASLRYDRTGLNPFLSTCHVGPSVGNGDRPALTLDLYSESTHTSYRVRPREKMSADGCLSLVASSSGAI